MFSLMRLIWKNFFRRMYEPIMAFGLPLLIYLILRYVIESATSDYVWMNYLLAGVSLYVPMVLGLMVMPAQIMQFKESVLIKRIGVTPVNTKVLTLSFLAAFLILSLLATTFIFVVVSIIEGASGTFEGDGVRQILSEESAVAKLASASKKAEPLIKDIGAVAQTLAGAGTTGVGIDGQTSLAEAAKISSAVKSLTEVLDETAVGSFTRQVYITNDVKSITAFMSFLVMANIMSLSCGLAISSISKSLPVAQAIGSAAFFPAMFLTGMYFPLSTEDISGYISWIVPWRSLAVLIFIAWLNPMFSKGVEGEFSGQFKGVSDTFLGTSAELGESYHTWLALGLSFLFTIIFAIVFFTKFKWSKIR